MINRQLGLIFAYLFIDLLSFTIILPWLPTIIEQLCSEDQNLHSMRAFFYTRLLKVDNFQKFARRDATVIGGISSSLMSLAQFLFSATAGTLSDGYGRKPVLLGLHCLGILSCLMWAGSNASFAWFLLSRIVSGVSRSNIACLSAMVSDLSDREARTRGMAAVGVAYSLAFLIGPPASALLLGCFFGDGRRAGVLGPTLGICAAVISSGNLIVLLAFSETVKQQPDDDDSVKNTTPVSSSFSLAMDALRLVNPRELFAFRDVLPLSARHNLQQFAIVYFLNMLFFSGLECSLLFLGQLRFGYTSRDQGRIFLFIGVMMTLIQGGFVRRFKVGREIKIAFWAMYAQVLSYLVLGIAPNQMMFYMGLLLFSFMSAAFVPSFTGLVSLNVGPKQQGQILGTFRSLNALGRAIGPALIGLMMWLVNPFFSFTIGAICTALVIVVFQRSILSSNKQFASTVKY